MTRSDPDPRLSTESPMPPEAPEPPPLDEPVERYEPVDPEFRAEDTVGEEAEEEPSEPPD